MARWRRPAEPDRLGPRWCEAERLFLLQPSYGATEAEWAAFDERWAESDDETRAEYLRHPYRTRRVDKPKRAPDGETLIDFDRARVQLRGPHARRDD